MRAALLAIMILLSGCATLDSEPVVEHEQQKEHQFVEPSYPQVIGATAYELVEHTAPENVMIDATDVDGWNFTLESTPEGLLCGARHAEPMPDAQVHCAVDIWGGDFSEAYFGAGGEAILLGGIPDVSFDWTIQTTLFDAETNQTDTLAWYTDSQFAYPDVSSSFLTDLRTGCDRLDELEAIDGPAGLRVFSFQVEAHNGMPRATLDLDSARLHDINTTGEWTVKDGTVIVTGEWGHRTSIEGDITLDLEAPANSMALGNDCGRPALGSNSMLVNFEARAVGVADGWHESQGVLELYQVFTTV